MTVASIAVGELSVKPVVVLLITETGSPAELSTRIWKLVSGWFGSPRSANTTGAEAEVVKFVLYVANSRRPKVVSNEYQSGVTRPFSSTNG